MLLRIVDTKHMATTVALIEVCKVSIKGGNVVVILTDQEVVNLKHQVESHASRKATG